MPKTGAFGTKIAAKCGELFGPYLSILLKLVMARILIVEDGDDLRAATARFLTKVGYSVTEAANGRDGLAKVIAEAPDLILTDVQMPELDGASFLEVVRAYLRLHSIPVVVLTGIDDGPLIERIRAQKVSAILVKGKATLDDIAAAISEALVTLPT